MSPAPSHRHRRQAATPTRVNLGPLTTVYVQPSHCSRAALAGPSATEAIRGQSCKVSGATANAEDDITGCWPRATEYPANRQRGIGFYSPGYECPAGYTSACTAISATRGQTTVAPKVTGTFQFPLLAGETAVGCCPNGYGCAMDGGVQTCMKTATSTQFDAMTCKGQEEDLNAFKVPFTTGSQTIGTMTLWAPLIQLNHFATDLPEDKLIVAEDVTTSSESSSSTMTMETALPSTPAVSTPMPTESSKLSDHLGDAVDKIEEIKEERSRLSTGAKIGIAFAPLMVAGLIVAFLFYRKWKAHYLYPQEHFLPPKKPVSPSSPNPSELQRSPYNEDAANAGKSPRTTPYSPPMPQGPHNKSPNMTPFSPPMAQSPYNISHNPHDFATGGPGPVVVAPYGYGRNDKMSDIDEESGYHYHASSPPHSHAAQFSRTVSTDGPSGVESPIDGTSPFRLKRGNTLKRLTADREAAAHSPRTPGVANNGPAHPSPLVQNRPRTASDSSTSTTSDVSHAHHPSQDGIVWDYPLKRENSFSRPRPKEGLPEKPRAAVTSVYVDRSGRTSSAERSRSRSSSLYSWNNGAAPSLSEAAAAAVTGLNRTRSFSRPLVRSKREASENTLVEPNVVVPRVTSQGVAF